LLPIDILVFLESSGRKLQIKVQFRHTPAHFLICFSIIKSKLDTDAPESIKPRYETFEKLLLLVGFYL